MALQVIDSFRDLVDKVFQDSNREFDMVVGSRQAKLSHEVQQTISDFRKPHLPVRFFCVGQ